MKAARFKIGDIVKHITHGYRAVVIDVDPIFQASGRHNPRAIKESFATKNPWYRLLVDESNQITYVEEPHLMEDINAQEIINAHLEEHLGINKSGGYIAKQKTH